MKISVNWLKDYLTFDEPAADLAHDLSMLGLTVDTIDRQGSHFILDIDVTANRPDCLSVIGVAREIAAIQGIEMCPPVFQMPETEGEIETITSVGFWRTGSGTSSQDLFPGP